MKKQSIFIFLTGIFLLAGCSSLNANTANNYIDTSVKTLQASSNVEQDLEKELLAQQTVTDQNGEQLKESIVRAKTSQENLYEILNNQDVPAGMENVKESFLEIISTRVASDDQFLETISLNDAKALTNAVQMEKKEDDSLNQKALVVSNQVLKSVKGSERSSLK